LVLRKEVVAVEGSQAARWARLGNEPKVNTD
jgi:hypothetical protein